MGVKAQTGILEETLKLKNEKLALTNAVQLLEQTLTHALVIITDLPASSQLLTDSRRDPERRAMDSNEPLRQDC